ncbi:MAG: FAD-dependent oxidoreductase [Dehalococcoidales bacterium]|nr:FAD-dependent oxidoreductase [Dehalococcoidales bacterium]
MELEKLFTPINVGSMRLKNRIVMSPMGTNYADKDGLVTARQIAYYAERAKGGAGAVTTEVATVTATGKSIALQLGVYGDECVPGLTKMASAINEYDCRSIIQLHHAGRRAASKKNKGVTPKAPSPIPVIGGEMPLQMTEADIEAMIEAFADAAVRAKKAGWSAVELHGAHGYLIAQFLSALANKRTDRWGGSLENRTRFAVEVVKRIKQKAGSDYPVVFKLSVDEFLPGGNTQADSRIIAKKLQEAGVNAISCSAGHTGAAAEGFARPVPGASFPRGCNVPMAEALKGAVSIPVGAIGRINEPILADSILKDKKADLIYMGRALIADAEFPMKAKQGRFEDIRTCIACSMCNKTLHNEPSNMSCTVNAFSGREGELKINPTSNPKKVLVIGGGPAGMEAARVAALRGHKVTLYEKNKQLGGQLLIASIPPHKDEIPYFLQYLITQLGKVGVTVKTGEKVTASIIKRLKPDVIINAVGSVPFIPPIPGADGPNVVIAEDVLTGKSKIKGSSVVMVGGGIVGCETAEFLAMKGTKVTIVEMLPEIGGNVEDTAKILLCQRLDECGTAVLTKTKVKKITAEGIVLEDGKEIKAGTVVLAVGRKSDTELAEALKGAAPEVYAIGDAARPRMIIDASREGAEIALKI